jgi:hypothetical protein
VAQASDALTRPRPRGCQTLDKRGVCLGFKTQLDALDYFGMVVSQQRLSVEP